MAKIDHFGYFPFVGNNGVRAYSRLLSRPRFPTAEIVKHRDEFLSAAKRIYKQEKVQNPISSPKKMDLTRIADVEKLYFHVRVHAITGLLEWGTSITYSIPYWDIQALSVGLESTVAPANAQAALERNHIESAQALLSYLYIAGETYKTAKTFLNNMNGFKVLGNVTRSNLAPDLMQAKHDWENICGRLGRVVEAKFKHLIFTADQIVSEKIRKQLLLKVRDIRSYAGLDIDSIVIDLGIDGGLTKDSYRPPYQIAGFAQLVHVGKPTFAVEKNRCPKFTFSQLIKSMRRSGDSKSKLIDPSRDIMLPWKIER